MARNEVSIGNLQILSLTDGKIVREPTSRFPSTTMEDWETHYPDLLDSRGGQTLRMGSTVVRSGSKLVLVDTGMQHEPGGDLMDDMRDKGIDPGNVDIVVNTHLHADHVGWNITDGHPTFPNARYLVPGLDFDYWTQHHVGFPDVPFEEMILPLLERRILELVGDGHKVTDEITIASTPGHTPGHISLSIASEGERGYILGDAAHSPAQVHHTEWCHSYDINGELGQKTRRSVMEMLENDGSIVSAGHFPGTGLGRVVREGSKRLWQLI